MDIGVIGVSHHTADVNFRERLAKNFQRGELKHFLYSFSKVPLFTCNRFEIYFHAPSITEAHSSLLDEFTHEFNQTSHHKLYSYFGQDCFFHLCKVTAGIDSAIFGETEIQGQVKKAYLEAHQKGLKSKELHFIFQKSLKIGKDIRQIMPVDTEVFGLARSVSDLVKRHLLKPNTIPKLLFIGASETNQHIIRQLKTQGVDIYLANRTLSRAEELAKSLKIKVLSWHELNSWVEFEGVVLATHHPDYLIHMRSEKIQSKLIVDLSVPRNADPELGKIWGVQLYNIDQINQVVRQREKIMLPEVQTYLKNIQKQVELQYHIFKNKDTQVERLASVV